MLTLPTININGSAPQVLADDYREAYAALCTAVDMLAACRPHGRDYQLAPDTLKAASAEHEARITAVVAVRDDVSALVRHCLRAVKGR